MSFDHVGLHVADIEKSRQFYLTALKPLGYRVIMDLYDGKLALIVCVSSVQFIMDFRPISASLMNESALLNRLKTFHLSLSDLFVLLSSNAKKRLGLAARWFMRITIES